MAITLHIQGPGIDIQRVLSAGAPQVVLGRGSDCDIRLPDPQRNMSRHHLGVWCDADALHFRVLSIVNGVDLPDGEAPPGAIGVLPAGQTLVMGVYSVVGTAAPVEDDPWAALESMAAPPDLANSFQSTLMQTRSYAEGDDPFSDWGLDARDSAIASMLMPEPAAPQAANAGEVAEAADGATDLRAFYRGMGLEAEGLGHLSEGELEELGGLVRDAMVGLLELYQVKMGLQREMGAEDRTMMATTNNNPLKTDWPLDVRLRYLAGGRTAAAGFIAPQRALAELLGELRAHDVAAHEGSRAVVRGTLKELAPAAIRKAHGGARLFEGAKLWEAYENLHARQGDDAEAWVQRQFDRHFADTYLRELRRLLREMPRS